MNKSESELKKDFDAFVERALPSAKLVALSELIGGNYLMRKEFKLNSQGDITSEKYVVIPWEDSEEILKATNALLNNESNDLGDDYFLLSQRPPSHRFWESLLARTIGKPIEQLKVEQNVNMYSETVANAKKRLQSRDGSKEVTSSIADWL